MKHLILIFAGFLIAFGSIYSQKDKKKKDSQFDQKLLCPFENGMGRVPKEAFTWDPPDMKVIMVSKIDTAVRCCIDSKVLSINPTEDGRFELIVYYKDYYFWYYGITRPLVNVNQLLKAGQILGTYSFGIEMEFRMFKDEEMMDPREYLECKFSDGNAAGR